MPALPPPTWEMALREFLLHKEAHSAAKTTRFYKVQLGQLVLLATEQKINFDEFGKRHMDRYLVAPANTGKSKTTLHHDALCAKVFMEWCAKEGLTHRALLEGYEVRNAPRPPRYMPSTEEVRAQLIACRDFWNIDKLPNRSNKDLVRNPCNHFRWQ